MKKTTNIFWAILFAIAFAASPLMAAPGASLVEVGTTAKVINIVKAKTLGRRLKLGDKVVYQETVSTGQKSAVDIRLIDESVLVMGELSELILDNMVYDPNRGVVEGTIEAVKGIFRFSSSGVKMDVSINTPFATIGVRGTEFDVYTDEKAMQVAVIEGAVEVTSALGTESVSRGQVYSVDAQGRGGLNPEPSPEMKQAVSLMLTLVADQGKDEAAAPAGAPQTASLPPAAAFKQAVKGKDAQNMVYMDLGKGRLVIELDPKLAPNHVKRVKELARQGFYDGLSFHFVRPGYVAETGDPTGTGQGGSGQKLAPEFSDVPFERGVVGMSREEADSATADSQFFIALGRAAKLDGKYTVIGKVINGIELADGLKSGNPPKDPDKIVRFSVAADVKD
ncbi:MAG: peptidylprolyl isomerase [Proteobacteria bacterium]|nr:peptidylprolyl isomerase [Pseudomonadota bacterium]